MTIPRTVLETIDSTNAEAMRRVQSGTEQPFWLLARTQSAGRGRRGRAWASCGGNLHASLALRVEDGPAGAALRSFVAALALAQALESAGVARAEIALKWPNDVLVGGRKIAGILLESSQSGDHLTLIIGLGVNLAAAPGPDDIEPGALPPISLAELDLALAPEAFLDLLDPEIARWEGRLAAEGFAPIRAAWLARAARLGEEIEARLPDRTLRGRFETVDDSGALVLLTDTGRTHLPAADIHF